MKLMKRYGRMTGIAFSCALAPAYSALAGVEVSPTFPEVDKHAPAYSSVSPTADWGGDEYPYNLTEVTISAGGDFTYFDWGYLGGCGVDQRIQIYTDFNPTDTDANSVYSTDDSATVTLSPGTYDFVSRPYSTDAPESGVMWYSFSSSDGGVAQGLPATSSCADGYIVTFDGTEPVADFDGTSYQYIVVGSFTHAGGYYPPAAGDAGYLLDNESTPFDDYPMDTRAFYFEGEFVPGDIPALECDDSCDDPLPAGSYTLVITTFDEPTDTGTGFRVPVIGAGQGGAATTPVPVLPAALLLLLSAFMALFGMRALKRM